jgi:DNA helicase HerA-like ATPase
MSKRKEIEQMNVEKRLMIGKGRVCNCLLPEMANRHGLIAGATGTGKTTTLKVMAESFSSIGVPVFLADIKGDLAGLALPGNSSPNVMERLEMLGVENFDFQSFPVQFWDLYGEKGIPVRTSISEMGPIMLSRILGLNEIQSGILSIIFRIADDKNLLLIDLKDLKAMVKYVGDNSRKFSAEYGNIATQSIGAILRSLLNLEDYGGNYFFGEPELDFSDWMKVSEEGKGYINILDSAKLFLNPELYSTFLLWMLSSLFENLPEIGDTSKPKMIFFFDEAHLLFKNMPKVLRDKIEQVVRLIRSKGVGVYFVTQTPTDLPKEILGQLGNKILHALRAYTPADLRIVHAVAESFRSNNEFDTANAISELATGEALISFLDENGTPNVVDRATIVPPRSAFGTLDAGTKAVLISQSPFYKKYSVTVDRESAYEVLQAKTSKQQSADMSESKTKDKAGGYQRQTTLEKATNAVVTTIGREVSRSLIRGILGSLKR